MADTKISALAAVTTVDDTDEYAVARSGASKKITGANLKAGAVAVHLADTSDAHDASAISFSPASGIAATDVQAAIVEDAGDLAAHLADTGDAHDASAISIVDAGTYFTGTDVEAALQELGAGGGGGSVASDTIWDAKGDLAVATAADTASRLAVGSNDTVLVADSGQATGVKWAAVPGTSAFVPVSTIDAKGDLLVGSANDAVDNLAVGTNGDVLTADSAQTLGVKWAAPAGGGGAWTLLHTVTRATDGTFDQASISGSYNDLILVVIARGTRSAFTDELMLRFNNDSGSNYYREVATAIGTTAAAVQSGAATSITTSASTGGIPAASAAANAFGVYQATIYGYKETTWLKKITYEVFEYCDPGTGSQISLRGGGVWVSTAAINRIQMQGLNTANLLTGSQLRIYGRL